MVMNYETAIQFFCDSWAVGIRDSRNLLANCRNGKPITCGYGVVYYRSDRKYELIDEREIICEIGIDNGEISGIIKV